MQLTDCELCDSKGQIIESKSEHIAVSLEPKIALDRRSSSYKNAVNEIMDLDKNLTREDAVKIFEKEYYRAD